MHPTSASLSRVDPTDGRRQQAFDFRDGKWEHDDDSVSTVFSTTDLSKFDSKAVLATLDGAAQVFDFKNLDGRWLVVDGDENGGLEVRVYVSDHDLNGYEELNPDGTVRKVHPPS